MRIWFAICFGISLLLLTMLVLSMSSCVREFDIDPQGRLAQVTTIQTEGNPPVLQYQVKSWDVELPEFRGISAGILPGDHLTHTRHITGFPFFNLEMTRLEVFRKEARVLVVRNGALRFWTVIGGLSVFPLLCWAGGALWAISGRPRSQPV